MAQNHRTNKTSWTPDGIIIGRWDGYNKYVRYQGPLVYPVNLIIKETGARKNCKTTEH